MRQFSKHLLLLLVTLPAIAGSEMVTAWGDSMTGGHPTGWPAQFALLSGATMNARGVGGQTSTQIKDRMIAEPARWGDFTILWAGRNNYGSPETVKADIATMVSKLTTTNFLVISICNGDWASEWVGGTGYETLSALNAELKATYGGKFLDVRKILVDAYNPALPQDVIDHGHDVVPLSLRGDSLHLNDAGNLVVANVINQAYAPFAPYTPDTKWTPQVNGVWHTPANWTHGLPAGAAVNSANVPEAGNAILPPGAFSYAVDLNAPATVNDLTLRSTIGTLTTLNLNAALTSTGINQTGTPLGRLITSGSTLININSGGSASLGAQVALTGGTLNVNAGATLVWGHTAANQSFLGNGATVNIFGSVAGTTGIWRGNQSLAIENGGMNSNWTIDGGSASADAVMLLANCGNATLTILNGGALTIRNNTSTAGIVMGNVWNPSASAYANQSTLNLVGGAVTNGAAGLLKISANTAAANAHNSAAVNISGGTFQQFATTTIGSGRRGSLNLSGTGVFSTTGDMLVGGLNNQISAAPAGGSVTASGTLSISGGVLTARNLYVGDGSFAFLGGSQAAWNSPGILNLSSGTLTVTHLSCTNVNGTIDFSGGTLDTAGTTLANGSRFQVGDGSRRATLILNGGAHGFANGLAVATQSTLRGRGSITGNLSLSGSYAPRIQSAGTPDLVSVTGTLALESGARLLPSDAEPLLLPVGTTRTVLSASGGLTGRFSGLDEGALLKVGPNLFAIHYSATAVSLQSVGSYLTWATENDIAGEPADGDYDGDGLANLMEYALGLAQSVPGGDGHLDLGRVTDAGHAYFSLIYTRPEPPPGDILYTVEACADLTVGDWSSNGLQQAGSSVSDGLRTLTIRDTLPMSDAPSRFMRLRISRLEFL